MGGKIMTVNYDSKTDLLHIRLDIQKSDVTNRRFSDDVVLDINEEGKIVGIEIMDASKNIEINALLPVEFHVKKAS